MLALSVVLVLAVVTGAEHAHKCRVWFSYNTTSNRCECGSRLGGVVDCDSANMRVSLLYCYCMTYNKRDDTVVVGACAAMCTRKNTPDCQSFNQIQTNESEELDDEMCSGLHRTGQLCGSCVANYSTPVYSYTLDCVECAERDFPHNLVKYVVVAFVPLTAFYFFVITLKTSVTSGSMVAYILMCQVLTAPYNMRNVFRPDGYQSLATMLIISYHAVWNLDFLRSVYPPFCLHPKLRTLHVLALDYLVGLYPLLLIFMTYIVVVIHDRYRRVAMLCRPAHKLLMCFRVEFNIRSSLVQTFASFLILSYVKILNVSFDLLFPVSLKTVDGKTVNQTYLYNDGEVLYFGKEHAPFGILAVVMLTVFNIAPLLLLLIYPCRCFQVCLNRCGITTPLLFTFMDAFQGCYRHHPRDCRYFAGIYLLFRVLPLLTFALTRDYIYIPIMAYLFIALTGALIVCEPYKRDIHNKTDKTIFLLFSSFCILTALNAYLRPSEPQIPIHKIYVISSSLLLAIPSVYNSVIMFRALMPRQLSLLVKASYRRLYCTIKHRHREEGKGEHQLPVGHLQDELSPLLQAN